MNLGWRRLHPGRRNESSTSSQRPLLNSWVAPSCIAGLRGTTEITLGGGGARSPGTCVPMNPRSPLLWCFHTHSAGGQRSSAKPAGPQRGWAGCCRWRSGWRCPRPSGPRRCRQPGSWSHPGPGRPPSLGWSTELGGFSSHFWPVSPPSKACTPAWGRMSHVSQAQQGGPEYFKKCNTKIGQFIRKSDKLNSNCYVQNLT